MPELGDERSCNVCFRGTQTFKEMGRTNVPRPVAAGEKFEPSRHRVWQCDRDPKHIHRPEDPNVTQIKPCPQCGGFMFYTMRLHEGRFIATDPARARRGV